MIEYLIQINYNEIKYIVWGKEMDEFSELIRREFEEIAAEEEKELENMELGLSDEEFQVIKSRALNGVIERIRLHQQNEKRCYL